MPATIKHVFSNAIADGTNTNIVRPVDWNSVHALTLNLSGTDMIGGFSNNALVTFSTNPSGAIVGSVETNYQAPGAYLTTAALSNHSHGNPTLALTNLSGTTASNSAGLTLSLSAAAPGAGGGVAIAGGTQTATSGTVVFSNSNGVSFGLSGSTRMTASVADALVAMNFTGNVLYTDANNQIGISNKLIHLYAGRNITASVAPNFSATYSLSAEFQPSISNVGNTAGTSGTYQGPLVLAGSNNITLSQSTGTFTTGATNITGTRATITISGPDLSPYLTTAMASNRGSDFIQANAAFAGTNASGTITSNGISVSVAAQSAQPVAASASNGSFNFSTLKFVEGSGVTWATQANGIQASVKTDYLTTAMQSNAVTLSNIRVSGGTTSNLLSALTFADSNGVSFGLNAGTLTATVKTDYQTAGAYLTTAMQSNAATISNIRVSAGTTSNLLSALTFDNANGITFGLNASTLTASHNGLTTAALSNHSHGNPQLNLTNLSGTTASNSAGFTLSLSANGAAAGVGIEAGTRTATTAGNLRFETGNGLTFGLDAVGGSVMTASHNGLTTAAQSDHSHGNPTLALTNLSGTTASASNGLTLSLSAAAPGGGAAATYYDWDNTPVVGSMNLMSNITATAFSRGRPLLFPLQVEGHLVWNRARINVSRSTSGSNAFTINCGLYSFVNSTQISLVGSFQNTYAASDTGSISGIRAIEITHANTDLSSLTPGHYIGALGFSASGDNTASMNYSLRGGVTVNPPVGIISPGAGVNITATSALSSIASRAFKGLYSATSSVMPNSIGLTQMSMWTTGGGVPYFWMGSR